MQVRYQLRQRPVKGDPSIGPRRRPGPPPVAGPKPTSSYSVSVKLVPPLPRSMFFSNFPLGLRGNGSIWRAT